jgi:hypothetical protein
MAPVFFFLQAVEEEELQELLDKVGNQVTTKHLLNASSVTGSVLSIL